MKGFVKDIEDITVRNKEFRRVALHGQELSARCHGVEAQGGDRDGSAQAQSVLSRGGRDGRGRSRWCSHADQLGLRRSRPCWDES